MRKFTLMSALLLLTIFASGQERTILLEQFTQASSTPCAFYNPNIETIVQENDRIVQISYQTDTPGIDPMNDDNEEDVTVRKDLYEVGFIPISVIDGGYVNGNPVEWIDDQALIDDRLALPPGVEIQLEADVSEDYSNLSVSAIVTAVQDIASSNLHLVVIEERINWDVAPGSNGETHFNMVMKKMLPSPYGTFIGALSEGESTTVTESWATANVYDPTQLRVVAFVQEVSSKDVHQAAYATPNFAVGFANNGALLEVLNVPTVTCAQQIQPSLRVRNDGASTMTSMEISYRINDGPEEVYEWFGIIEPLATEDIVLPIISFGLAGSYSFTANIETVNGSADENQSDSNVSTSFEQSQVAENVLNITIVTDQFGHETYWEVRDAAGVAIASGGNPNIEPGSQESPSSGGYEPYSTNEEAVVIPDDGCYTFYIADSYGDGLCCNNGEGSFSATDQDGNTIFSGAEFDAEIEIPFEGRAGGVDCTLEISSLETSEAVGGDNGSATVGVAGAVGALEILWNNGETTSTISGLAPGSYSVEVTDALGCSDSESVTVEAVCALALDSSTVDDTNDMSTGLASVIVTGGFGQLSFDWDNGMTGATISGLSAGTYVCVVSDEEGCSETISLTIENVNTSLEDLEGSNFSQFPNPANEHLNIDFNEIIEDGEIVVLNVKGQEIDRFQISGGTDRFVLKTERYENGNYVYQVFDKGVLVGVKRMIVVH